MTLPGRYSKRLDWQRSASEQIAVLLREAILLCDLVPGQQVSESSLAASFDVSRAPVREALFKLKLEGLILTYRGRGTMVSKLSARNVEGSLFVREALELGIISQLCSEGIGAERLEALEELADRPSDYQTDQLNSVYALAKRDFHVALAGATNMARVVEVVKQEKAVCDRFFRFLELQGQDRAPPPPFAAILRFLKKNDAVRAKQAMQDYLHSLSGLVRSEKTFDPKFFMA